MSYRLSPAARAEGHRLHVHDTLASTNAQALGLAREGETGPLWVVAHSQSAGRGRRGNTWISPEGNLAASLLLPVNGVEPGRIATLGFVAGLALVRALDDVSKRWPSSRGEADAIAPVSSNARVAGSLRSAGKDGGDDGRDAAAPVTFALKWPNDVLADGRKIAGILLEAEGRRAVVIGIGVNVAAAPEDLPYPVTSLAALGCSTDAANLFEALSGLFVETLRIWNKGRGFSEVRRHWLERAAGVGSSVSVRLANTVLNGRHDGIDEEGRLVILAPDGQTHTVTAGEVHFGEAATAA